MFEIVAVLTCHNRKDKTENCIRSLTVGNQECHFTFVIVDDGSTDGTVERIMEIKKEQDIHLLEADGSLYYSGGMRKGMLYVLDNIKKKYDYLLMLNDDVSFFEKSIEKMIAQSTEMSHAVIVGATCEKDGQLSYSAIQYTNGIKYRKIPISEWCIEADTFNANAVLIPFEAFEKVGAMDEHYRHSLGDFDYGLALKRNGYSIHVSKDYVGICKINYAERTWTDPSLNRMERIKRKESVKGAPAKQWFYFLKKNFGIITAVKNSCTPYIRILLGK